MQFLTPLFWLGALAVSIPIILHLVRREKTERIPFASLMFLRRIPVKEFRRRQLRHLFLLALRCLGLLLLAAAFAQPVIRGSWLNQANPLEGRSVLLLIDRSLSMRPLWSSVLAAAGEQLDSLRTSDEAMIVQFGENVEVVTGWESQAEELRRALQSRVTPSYDSTQFSEALRLASEQFEEANNLRREIVLITDLQRSGLASLRQDWKLPSDVQLSVIPLQASAGNVFIEGVSLQRHVFESKYPNPVLIKIGTSPVRQTKGEALFYLQDQLVNRQSFSTDENGTAQVKFPSFELDEGISRGRVVVEPEDELPDDNAYHFVLERKRPEEVALLAEPGVSTFYLEAALSSGSNLPFTVTSINRADLRRMQPAERPLLVAADLKRPPDADPLKRYLEGGGGLILALGNRVEAAAYNQEIGDLIPIEILEKKFVKSQEVPFTSVTEIQWEHPVFSIFKDAQKAGIVETRFFGYWKVTPSPSVNVLARFSGGDPALLEFSSGPGRVLIFTSSIDSVWSDFPLRTAYLPFWQQLAEYTGRWSRRPAAVAVNFSLSVEGSGRGETVAHSGNFNVIDPNGHRVIGLDEERPGFISLRQPGYYEVRQNKNSDWIAVNPSPQESNLETLPAEQLAAAFVDRGENAQVTLEKILQAKKEREQSLWWFFLIAAAAVFVSEPLVANRVRAGKS